MKYCTAVIQASSVLSHTMIMISFANLYQAVGVHLTQPDCLLQMLTVTVNPVLIARTMCLDLGRGVESHLCHTPLSMMASLLMSAKLLN